MKDLCDWVVAAQKGDKEAFTRIVRRFQDMAYGVAYAMLGDAGLAQDAAQEAFIEAYLSLSTLREPAAFPGWFRRVVVKYSDRELRSQKPTLPLDEFLDFSMPADDPVAVVETLEGKQAIHEAIAALPPAQRQMITLFYLRDYSQKEIKEFLELPVSTIKKQLFTARKKLKGRLEAMVEKQIQANRPSQTNVFADKVQYFLALKTGDLDRVKSMAERQPELLNMRFEPPSKREGYGWLAGHWPTNYTAIHWAAATNDRALLEFLLDRKVDVNLPDRDGMTPLHVAVRMRQEAVLRLLIAVGADLNATTHEGHTPLHFAAMSGYCAGAEALLKAGGRLDVRDKNARTPLDWAVAKNAQSVVELLATDGAKRRTRTKGAEVAPSAAGAILETGIKVLDLFAPLSHGGENGMLTPLSNVGRLVLQGELVHKMAALYGGQTICFGLEGESVTAKDLLLMFRDAGVGDVVSVIFGHANEKPMQILDRAAAKAAEVRSEGREVLFLVQSEMALDRDFRGSIKALSAEDCGITTVYFGEETVGAEPEPLADLDSVITFDFNRAKQALYPAVDPINSGSRLLQNGKIGKGHREIAREARRMLRRYQDLRPIIESRGLELLPKVEDRKIVERAVRLDRFLTQPFHWAEPWTNMPGVHVPLMETLEGCRAILDGECDDMPEEAFYFVGNLAAAREKARSAKTKDSKQKN